MQIEYRTPYESCYKRFDKNFIDRTVDWYNVGRRFVLRFCEQSSGNSVLRCHLEQLMWWYSADELNSVKFAWRLMVFCHSDRVIWSDLWELVFSLVYGSRIICRPLSWYADEFCPLIIISRLQGGWKLDMSTVDRKKVFQSEKSIRHCRFVVLFLCQERVYSHASSFVSIALM
jgi:hypothetical protein